MDAKRMSLIGGVNKIGEAYGVMMQENGNLVKKSPRTSHGRRRIKYKFINHNEQKNKLQEIFASNRYILFKWSFLTSFLESMLQAPNKGQTI
jgi:hypothetical protein